MAQADKQETKRMKYQVEENQLAFKEEVRKDRHTLYDNMITMNNQNRCSCKI
jgi:hypothetical protein